jgi:squalene cyclase
MQGTAGLVFWVASMAVWPVIDKAITFLRVSRGLDGWWWDFYTRAGFSDEWVTGYVGTALAAVPDSRASQMAQAAWGKLRSRRRRAAGWGYNKHVPTDADSTLWALHLVEAVGGAPSRRVRRAHEMLARHVLPDGGVATYASEGPIRHFTRIKSSISMEGWCSAHPCVTAAAALCPAFSGREQALDFLCKTQSPDGGWNSYWWCDREYATAHAARALHNQGDPADNAHIQDAVEWARRRVGPDGAVRNNLFPGGSPFATALALYILALAGDRGAVREEASRALDWLLAQQQPDGSWRPTAALRIPPASAADPETVSDWSIHSGGGGGTIVIDQRALFTVATVLRALQEVRDWIG